MGEDFFAASDAAIARAGSSNPMEVMQKNNIVFSELTGTIVGMASRFSYLYTVGVNYRLDEVMRPFSIWHELGHIFRGHVDEVSSGTGLIDSDLFTQEVDSKRIPIQEKESNIISAEYCVDTRAVLDVIAYESQTMQDYRRLKAYQQKLSDSYTALFASAQASTPSSMVKYRLQEYRRALKDLEEKKLELESDIAAMECNLTFREIADALGTTETILRYKLEALRIRGYDIDALELERYNKVFRGAI